MSSYWPFWVLGGGLNIGVFGVVQAAKQQAKPSATETTIILGNHNPSKMNYHIFTYGFHPGSDLGSIFKIFS